MFLPGAIRGVRRSDGGTVLRVVVVGDIARPSFYHTGDEAMTEAVIDILRARGVDDIVLVAQDPDLATQTYGCPAVPRLAFGKAWSRERCDRELAALDGLLAGGWSDSDRRQLVVEAVAQADALLIAGGGNLRSEHRYMIYERLALVRAAKHYGKPVFVTSQTVGPMLEEADEALIREIVDYATCFGVREPTTEKLIRDLAADPARVVRTMDDSVLLDPRPEDFASLAPLQVPERYLVASFTYHAGSSGMSWTRYRRYLAGVLDRLAGHLDADVLLVPHVGSFDPEVDSYDRTNDAAILAASKSGRVRALPMLTAREVIALTSGALLALSTRYHSTVFATGQAVPSLALVTSYYSSIRMTGSLGNVGLSQYALPADRWSDGVILQAVDEALDPERGLREYLERVVQLRRAEQSAWWDALVTAMNGQGWQAPPVLSGIDAFPSGAWMLRVQDALWFADQHWRGRAELKRVRTELEQTQAELSTALAQLREIKPWVKRVRRNPAVRLAARARRLARRVTKRAES